MGKWKEPPDPPQEYLDAIREHLKHQTDALAEQFGVPRWTDEELDAYRDCNGWLGYYEDGYSARAAVLEDMSYWDG